VKVRRNCLRAVRIILIINKGGQPMKKDLNGYTKNDYKIMKLSSEICSFANCINQDVMFKGHSPKSEYLQELKKIEDNVSKIKNLLTQ